MAAPTPNYVSASLYVGDLAPEVTETQLFDIFKQVGPVASIRVCRDAVTRRSLGYAYVNYHQLADAERALDLLNYKEIKGRPCRIMWSQRDPNVRKGGAGNIFIKNLDKSIDNKALFDTFATFGNILSCKVALDEHGNSRGFGFVHYETEEAALNAIQNVNGMLLAEKKVFVGEFIARKEREKSSEAEAKWTNIFVKNLPKSVTDEKFHEMFSKYGKITSAILTKDVDDKSKGFGFVNFENHLEAQKAIDDMKGKEIDGQEIYVGRAQKKAEREKELKDMFEKLKRERMSKYQGVNLYVKNLDDTIDDERLRQEFANCGTITSAKVMKDDKGMSKGFGFVCFATPDEATKAVTDMNGKMLVNKPIYVALAQRKEQRRLHLEAVHSHRQQAMRMPPQGMPNPMYPGAAPIFLPTRGATGFVPYPQHMVPARGRFSGPATGGRGFQAMPFVVPPSAARGGHREQGPYPMGIKFNPNVRNPQQQQQVPVTEDKKASIGEELYNLVQQPLKTYGRSDLAGKVTGMLLESMETSELAELINSSEALDKKIAEALDVLEHHNMATKEKKGDS